MTPRERPARRGYILIAILSGVAVWACMQALHVAPFIAAGIVIAGILVTAGAFSLRPRGINREIRRRK